MSFGKIEGLEFCRDCGGTEKYDDPWDGIVSCDRCFYGYEPDQGECPKQLLEFMEMNHK